MTQVTLRYVNGFETKGKTRYYFRRAGKSYRLPDDLNAPEFHAEYQRLLQETQPPRLPEKVAPAGGTFSAVALQYYASPHFKDLTPASQRDYRRIIEEFCGSHGHRLVKQMRRANVIKIMGEMSGRPGAANKMLKRLRTLCEFAIELEWIDSNPTNKVKLYKGKEHHTWTEEEIAQFEAKHPIGTKRRLAFDAILYTGQRISDASKLPKPDASGKIRIVQDKSIQNKERTTLAISVHPSLQKSLDACPSGHRIIITTEQGRPFSIKGLGNYMADSIAMAKLPDRCVAHGLRKAAARRLAEAGCTPHEIMSVTGHRSLAEVERYTRMAQQEKLNEAAMEKVSPAQKFVGPDVSP